MAKKRQLDFQKTKLRVGRFRPKGRNITNTSFKSDKILIRQNITVPKPKSAERSLKEVLKGLDHCNAARLVENLNKCNACFQEDKNSIMNELQAVLSKILDATQYSDHNVRISAINTLQTILTFTSDVQISPFFLLLTTSVSCLMSHSNFEIRQDSLQLFDVILQTHPNLMWQHKIFLDHLLGMISHVDSSQPMDTRKRREKRLLENSFSENIKAQDWRMQVLGHMNNFLVIMLKNLSKDENKADDEQKIYWKDKQSLFIPIYLGGGLKPVDVKFAGLGINRLSYVYWEPYDVKKFILHLLPLLSGVYTEEMPQILHSTKESPVSRCTLENLGILFQVLYHLGKWIKLVSNSHNHLVDWFSTMYYNNISNKVMRRFPFVQKIEEPLGRGRPRKTKPLQGIQLNLNICYLYSAFILGNSHSTMPTEKRVELYLESVLTLSYEECFFCIPLLVEIIKNYLCCSGWEGIKSSFLKGMLGKLDSHDSRPQQKQLQDFFIELSLSPEYKNISEIPAMKLWYMLLLGQLREMMCIGQVDKKLLKNIKKICSRQYPDFIKCLENIEPKKYIELLTFENEDFQETVVHLIYHTEHLSPDFLQEIAEEILLNQSLSSRTAAYIIRLLAHRFSGSDVTSMNQVLCLKFLLNIACDTISMEGTEYCNEEILHYMKKKWKPFKAISTYKILPSKLWEKHCKLYEVCVESLQLFPEPQKSLSISKFLQHVLADRLKMPVHCVIAISKLKNSFSASSYISQEKTLAIVLFELMFSCLLYTSLLSSYAGDWENYSIPEIQPMLDLNRQTVFKIVERIDSALKLCNAESAYYFLRIYGFLITNRLLIPEDKMKVISLIKRLELFCGDSAEYNKYFFHVCQYFCRQL